MRARHLQPQAELNRLEGPNNQWLGPAWDDLDGPYLEGYLEGVN